MEITIKEFKNCKNCGDQPLSMFYKQKDCRRKSGIRYVCRACALKKSKKYTDEHKEANLSNHRARRKQQRLRVLKYYSNSETPECACCKENIIEFLVIDHKDGGGNAHRREIGHENLVAFILKNNFPPVFRVLCQNCNSCIATYGGCAHKGAALGKGPGRGRPPADFNETALSQVLLVRNN
jgi:hypothetical protein